MTLPDQRLTTGFPHGGTPRSRSDDGTTGRPLHLTFTHVTVGSRGMFVHGSDSTGMVRVRVDRPGTESSTLDILLRYGAKNPEHAIQVDPEALLRTVETLDALGNTPAMTLTLSGSTDRIDLEAQVRERSGHFGRMAVALRDFLLVRDSLDIVLTLPAVWSTWDMDNIGILAGLLRGEELAMSLSAMVSHQMSTAEEARTYYDYIESARGARLEVPLFGWSLPVGGTLVPVEPLFVACTRVGITNADEVAAALAADDQIVPVELGPEPGSTVLGRRTPFPRPTAS